MDSFDNFKTDCVEIDKQHKEIMKFINLFCEMFSEGKNKELLISTLLTLENIYTDHCETEEIYMKKFNYPNTEKHKAEHFKINQVFQGAKQELMQSASLVYIKTLKEVMLNWFSLHINEFDKPLAELILSHS